MDKKNLYVHTFGCQMNVYDSERMAAVMEGSGYGPVGRAAEADLIIVNTCSIREKAKQKAFSELGRLKRLKELNPHLVIALGGCLAQQMGNEVFRQAPFVDIVFGTQNLTRLPEFVRAVEAKKAKIACLAPEANYIESLDHIEVEPGSVTAFVTIMQGCNNYCAFCVVPYLRGPEISRKSDSIIKEIRRLVERGVKEVTLIGQNVNSYGRNGTEVSYDDLLEEIGKISGLKRIRFTTSHPRDLSDKLIRLFGKMTKLCSHIHLPVQSGSNRILTLMNRGYTREEYLAKVDMLRTICPEISITSDIIVGFPGEEEDDFKKTIDLMNEVKFDNLFTFKYSEREGTSALSLPGKVSEEVKTERLQIIQSLEKKHAWEKNRSQEGRIVEVLVESFSKNSREDLTGRGRDHRIVNFKGSETMIGSLVKVLVTRAYLHSLRGELMKEVRRG